MARTFTSGVGVSTPLWGVKHRRPAGTRNWRRTAGLIIVCAFCENGVTDAPFRTAALRFGAPVVVSEMIASEALAHDKPEMLLKAQCAGGTLHVVQLAGREARWLAEGARRLAGSGADIIDINMGCPSKRVTTGYCGASLMRDGALAGRLVEAVVAASPVPVTVKMRLGWDEQTINAAEIARIAVEAGAQAITVHGRTRQQFYKGTANWSKVRAVRDTVNVPLVVNGDISSVADAREAGLADEEIVDLVRGTLMGG